MYRKYGNTADFVWVNRKVNRKVPSRDGEMDSLYVLGYLSGIYITPFVRLAASEWFWQTLMISFLKTSIFQLSILTKLLLGGLSLFLLEVKMFWRIPYSASYGYQGIWNRVRAIFQCLFLHSNGYVIHSESKIYGFTNCNWRSIWIIAL